LKTPDISQQPVLRIKRHSTGANRSNPITAWDAPLCFNVVFTYGDHRNRPYTFILGLSQRWTDLCFSNPNPTILFQNL